MSSPTSEPITVESDADEPPFAMVGDWVMLAPVSDRAVRVYCLLRAHINQVRGDERVWPSQEKLAAVLGLSKADEVGKAIKALEGIGAVRKEIRVGRKGRYTVYVVRRDPPLGYVGMTNASVDLHRPGVVDQLVVDRVKRLPHRAEAARNSRSEDITPDQGSSPEWATPDLGATPDPGGEAPPDQGCEPYKGEPDEQGLEKHTPRKRDAPPASPPCAPPPVHVQLDVNLADDRGDQGQGAGEHQRQPEVEFPGEIQEPDVAATDWSKRPKASGKFSKLSASASSMPARRLVNEFSSTLLYPLKGDIYHKWCAAVSKLLDEGVYPESVLRTAMVECMDAGKPPAALYSFASAVANRAPTGGQRRVATSTRNLDEQRVNHKNWFNGDGSMKSAEEIAAMERGDVGQHFVVDSKPCNVRELPAS